LIALVLLVRGVSALSRDERLEVDCRYARDPSLATDLNIVSKTVRVSVSRRGAF
jgi:lipopolysaccharide/colanic/teichoic acid biosynthesis glycosyltransferase